MPASRLRQFALIAAAAVLLSSGSAYAGGALARNSVGPAQVKDNSLGSNDIRNGSLRRVDVAKAQVPSSYTVIRRVPTGTTRILTIPGFSRFDATCSGSAISLNISFGDGDPATNNPVEQHGLTASDVKDNDPAGGVTITGQGGGVGFGTSGGAAPASGQFLVGDYWGSSPTLRAHGTFSWGTPSVPCLIRLQLVVQELATPVPVSKAVPGRRMSGGAVCERSGDSAAYCLPAR